MCPLFGGFTVIHVSGKALKYGKNSPATYGDALSYETCQQAFALCTKLLVGVVSLFFFGGNFVLAKVRLGLISVRCSELRGVCFSEVQNVLGLW